MNKLFPQYLAALFLAFGLWSCSKIEVDPNKRKSTFITQDIAVPIAFGDFSIGDLLRSDTNSYADVDQYGRIWLTYSNALQSLQAKNFMTNSGKKLHFYKTITEKENVNALNKEEVTISFSETMYLDFKSPNQISPIISAVHIKEGNLILDLGNFTSTHSSFEINIPKLIKDGMSLTAKIETNKSQFKQLKIDLAGYVIHPRQFINEKNKISVYCKAMISKERTDAISGSFEVGVDFNDSIKFEVIYGDFLRQQMLKESNSKIKFKLLDGAPNSNTIHFQDFKFGLKWENSFGIPMDLRISNIQGTNRDGKQFNLDIANVDPSQFIFTAPSNSSSERNGYVEFNNKNTFSKNGYLNTTDFIKESPIEMSFGGFTYTNPPGLNYPVYKNFIWKKSALNLSLETAFLLKGTVKDYKFEEVTQITMGEDLKNVQSATVKIHSENGFPLEFETQIEFRNAEGEPLFTLLEQEELFLKSGAVNQQGRVVAPAIQNREIELSEQEIKLLPQVKSMALVAVFSTTNKGNIDVEFNEADRLVLKLGLRVKYLNEIEL